VIYKEDMDKAQARVEAWWNGAVLDRPAILAKAPRRAPAPAALAPSPEELPRYFLDPDVALPRVRQELADSYFGGDSLPVMFPVSIGMVAILANLLGCPMQFVNQETTWHEPIVDRWDDRPTFRYDPDGTLWKACRRLMERAVAEADGYFVGVPDLNGPSEALALLRGTERFLVDFHDSPEVIRPALAEITQAWYRYWQESSAAVHKAGGYFYWMQFWSERPATDLQSDVSCMISGRAFRDYFLSSLEEQTRMVERTVYHLDGPTSIRHVDALLELPRLTGIQWIQGAGGGPVTKYLDLLRRIQDAGKLVSCLCTLRDLDDVMAALRPEGTFLVMEELASPDEADEAVRRVARWTNPRGTVA
jgi:hypothetical protein